MPVKDQSKERKGKILDTSILVKPSQLPQGGMDVEKHAEIIRNYQIAEFENEKAPENKVRLHIPATDNKYYKKNFTDLKHVFRKK